MQQEQKARDKERKALAPPKKERMDPALAAAAAAAKSASVAAPAPSEDAGSGSVADAKPMPLKFGGGMKMGGGSKLSKPKRGPGGSVSALFSNSDDDADD